MATEALPSSALPVSILVYPQGEFAALKTHRNLIGYAWKPYMKHRRKDTPAPAA